MKRLRFKEKLYKWIFTILAFASLFFLVGIVLVLIKEGLPIFQKISFTKFIFGRSWYPTYNPAEFGILPLILASVCVTLGAVIVCIPLGV